MIFPLVSCLLCKHLLAANSTENGMKITFLSIAKLIKLVNYLSDGYRTLPANAIPARMGRSTTAARCQPPRQGGGPALPDRLCRARCPRVAHATPGSADVQWGCWRCAANPGRVL